MERKASKISAAVGAVVRGRYRKVSMSQEVLAAKSGLTLTTVQRLIAGKAEFDTDQLQAIASVLNTTVSSLLAEAEGDLQLSDAGITNTHEGAYRKGDLAAAAEQRTDDDPDEEPDDT